MALSAVRAMQPSVDRLQQCGSQVVCAVTAGVGLLDEQTPATYRAAMASPDAAKWREAMDKEMASCEALQVWRLVARADLPRHANVLPPKWVYKLKTDETGRLWRCHVRPGGGFL